MRIMRTKNGPRIPDPHDNPNGKPVGSFVGTSPMEGSPPIAKETQHERQTEALTNGVLSSEWQQSPRDYNFDIWKLTSRERKHLLTYHSRRIERTGENEWVVTERKRKGPEDSKKRHRRTVTRDPATGQWDCDCPSDVLCKHIGAVIKQLLNGEPRGYIDKGKREWYPQDNARYNMVEEVMGEALPLLLHDLATKFFPLSNLGRRKKQRPFAETRDMLYCIGQKINNSASARGIKSLVRIAWENGLLYHRPQLHAGPPASSTITSAMQREHIQEAIECMIAETNKSFLGSKEPVFVDGCEFNTDQLQELGIDGIEETIKTWTKTAKIHVLAGGKSRMIIAAIVSNGKDHDSQFFISLMEKARTLRFPTAAGADRAYLTNEICQYLEDNGIETLIPAKSNTCEDPSTALGRHCIKWLANANGEHDRYGLRSFVENVFSVFKLLFDEDLRAKKMAAIQTTLLIMALLYNLRQLIKKYIYGEIADIFFMDRARDILTRARNSVKDEPHPDLSPRFRDNIPQRELEAHARSRAHVTPIAIQVNGRTGWCGSIATGPPG